VIATLGLCTGCVDIVVSLAPWFEVEEGESQAALFDARLLGTWCDEDEEGCDAEQAMDWRPGPASSYNVFGEGRLRHRVWLGEIDGTRYLDWWFLCEPSTGVEPDDCLELDFPLGTHIVARIDRMDEELLEFRILEGEKLEEYLAAKEQSLERARTEGTTLVLEGTSRLQEFLALHGDEIDLWSEETMKLVRRGD
jgi:hypothetical protein